PSAVARCKAAGRAEVFYTADAPGAVYAQLATALLATGVAVTAHRNGGSSRHAKRNRPGPIDPADFAATVARIAEGIDADPTPEGKARGRFGERKVFIAAIHRRLRKTKYGRLPRATVDELFLDSRRKGLLQLARADFVAAMDPSEVRDSEIQTANETF